MSDKKDSYVLTRKEYNKLLLAIVYSIIRSDLALSLSKKTNKSMLNQTKA